MHHFALLIWRNSICGDSTDCNTEKTAKSEWQRLRTDLTINSEDQSWLLLLGAAICTKVHVAGIEMASMSPHSLIATSEVAAVVSDPRQPDNPIIACNPAFLLLTGYSSGEVLGRNCRFLCGETTEPDMTARLREAISAVEPTMVELTNYCRDRTTFRNAVMIAPLFDEEGKLLYFLGSQMEIGSSSFHRRQIARERIDRLSNRQAEILQDLAGGRRNKQIAYSLGVTERTVKMHRAALLRALGVRTNAEAIRLAIEADF